MDGETSSTSLEVSQESLEQGVFRLETQMSLDPEALARVLVLYTGGTIGMVNKNGAYEPEPHCMVSKLRSLPIFHNEEFIKKNLPCAEQQRFLALPRLQMAGN
ncbi:hypothetical protein BaRGS_00003155, partial [Batillaria attramentaria]